MNHLRLYFHRYFSFFFILAIFLVLPLSMAVIAMNVIMRGNTQSHAASKGQTLFARSVTETEFVSNEILIKVKKGAKNTVKEGKVEDTGIESLNKLNKEFKVNKFQKLAKGKERKNNTEDLGWFKLALEGPREVLRGSVREEELRGLEKLDTSKLKDKTVQDRKLKLKVALAKFKRDPNVEKVELNYIVHTTQESTNSASGSATQVASPSPLLIPTPSNVPNDPYYSSAGSWGQSYDDLWGIKKINAADAWKQSSGSADLVVGVIDTGVDRNHPDMTANMWTNVGEIAGNGIDDDGNGYVDDVNGWNFAGQNNEPMDDFGHGTHVAGTIGAVTDNSLGVAGLNWNAKIMAVKFLDSQGSGTNSDAVLAINYAVNNGAKVLNNSWGGRGKSAILDDVIDWAVSNNVVFVAAAGNDNSDARFQSPADSPSAITVAASDQNDQKAIFSNWGSKIDVAAPGVEILSLRATINPMCTIANAVGARYCRVSGTSMATPHVAGLAALILSKHPDFTSEEVRQVLRTSTDKISNLLFDNQLGYGRINAGKALTQSLAPPTVKISNPQAGTAFGSKGNTIQVTGTVTSRNPSLNWQVKVGDEKMTTFKTVGSGSSNVLNSTLAVFDLSTVIQPNVSSYSISVEATDQSGTKSVDRVPFTVYSDTGFPVTISNDWIEEVVAQDLDNDGSKEVVGISTKNLYVWNKEGNFLPGWPKAFPLADGSLSVSVGDVAGDDKKEIIALHGFSNSSINVYDISGNELPGWPRNSTTDYYGYGCSIVFEDGYSIASIEDVNGDGKGDITLLAYTLEGPNAGLHVDSFDGKGNVLAGWPKKISNDIPNNCGVAVGDTNGDGKAEIAVTMQGAGVHLLDAGGNYINGWPKLIGFGASGSPTIVDLDNDGKGEVIFGSAAFKFDGQALFQLLNPVKNPLNSLVAGDLDNDGKSELITHTWYGTAGFPNKVEVFDLKGVMKWERSVDWAYSCVYCEPKIGDVNGDGNGDVLIIDSGELYGYDANNTQVYRWGDLANGFYVSSAVITDLDSDGKNDLLITSFDVNNNQHVTLVHTDGQAKSASWPSLKGNGQRTGALPPVPGLVDEDTDSDGCTDAKELGADWHLGGQRDPNNRWDFFDVPVPAITAANAALPVGDPGRPKFNKAISLQDVGAVQLYVGTVKGRGANANGVSYDTHYGYQMGLTSDPNFTDGMFYDRTPSADASKPWLSGPGNGAVSLQDVGVALTQVGTNCN